MAVLLGGPDKGRLNGAGILVSPNLHLLFLQLLSEKGKEFLCNASVHQQGFACIAHADSLGLGIENNVQGHILVRGSVHIHMAVACACLYNRDGAVFHHGLYESCSSPGDEHIDIPV